MPVVFQIPSWADRLGNGPSSSHIRKRLVNGLAPQSQKCLGIRLEVQRPVVSRYAVAILQADLMDA
jgi:hypothetical protein